MSIWNEINEQVEKKEVGPIFVRLNNDGDAVKGAFCGTPKSREVHWTGERYEECPGEDDCEYCKSGKRPKTRVALNFYVPDENSMKVMEGGGKWYKDIFKVREKYGLDKWTFEIQRHGKPGDPKTTYTVLPEKVIDEKLQARIDSIGMLDLDKLVGGKGAEEKDPTIDLSTIAEAIAKLKKFSAEEATTILAKYGVQKIRELKEKDKAHFMSFLAQLEANSQASIENNINPFE